MKKIIIYILPIVLLITSCQKDTDTFFIDPGQINGVDTSWPARITDSMPIVSLKNEIKPSSDSRTFNYTPNTALSFPLTSGMQFSILSGSLKYQSGAQVTSGPITIESFCTNSKGDIIKQFLNTTSNHSLLNAGGLFYIAIKKNNEVLAPSSDFRMKILFYPTFYITSQMSVYSTSDSMQPNYNWTLMTGVNNIVELQAGNNSFEIYSTKLGWLMAAHDQGIANNITTVIPRMPSYFTNANTQAFLVFQNGRSIVALEADVANKKFKAFNIPATQQASLVIISKMGNDYYMSRKDFQTNTTSAEQNVDVTPTHTTLSGIEDLLMNL